MKGKWGALLVDGRNKIGGHVASKNRGGAYLRTKVTPVNPQAPAQTLVRNRLASLAQNWRGLTAAQRSAWNGAVGNFARTDIFGDLKNPSGFNLYVRLNANILAVGGDVISTPPPLESLDSFTGLALTYTSGTPALSISGSTTTGDVPGYKLFATAPQSAGISFVKSEYRLISGSDTAPTFPFNILSLYTAKFGSVGPVGSKIFVKLVPVGGTNGLEGVPIEVSAISAT